MIGGADRWRRRLDGLAAELAAQIRELQSDDPDDARIDKKTRDLDSLAELRAFVLPLVDEIGAWPARARWGDWLARLAPFARRVLRQPERVVQVLAGLAPMADVGPVTLAEVKDVLAERLGTFFDAPSMPRYGKVFVAATAEARGRAFTVAFVPGVAERMFPRAIHEDPLLADDLRRDVPGLLRQDGRAARERLWLRLAVGAATDRVYVSFPRVDSTGGRARVPSFYALELMRAVTGDVPDYESLTDDARGASSALLAWPAPLVATDAIDEFEHDLSILRALLRDNQPSKGRAQYILQLNAHLRRSLTSQWNRARSVWTFSDGIVRATDAVKPFLATQRLGARAYSVSALQHYAACPYRFLLSAIYRFAPVEEPVPLQKMDPLTRGSLFHQVQADLFRALQHDKLLPPKLADRDRVLRMLDRTIDDVAGEFAEKLAPAIDRVWRDEVAALGRDLHVWIDQVMRDDTWEPWRFEFAFGLRDQTGRDEHSLRDPVTIDGRFQLRGSIDLVEKKRGGEVLRVTDYKTGRNRSPRRSILAGGTMLQPVIYSLAVEAATALKAESARLLVLHDHRQLRRARGPDHRSRTPCRHRGAGDRRSCRRARRVSGGAEREGVRVLRLPPRLRSGRRAALEEKSARAAGRSRRSEEPAMKTLADARDRALIRTDALDDTLVVEAAAGTGKTTELVARIVRVIATGRAQISEVAAVTFTEKAAGELKLRLRQEVEQARRDAGAAEAGHLDAALRKLEEARVTTIHGFCAELLRERPVEAGIDPLFQVMTESQSARLFNGVFERWLQETLADPPEAVRRLLRRRAWPSEEEGSIEGLRRAGHDLTEWRDFDGEWMRPELARRPRIDAMFEELHRVAALLGNYPGRYDALFSSTWPIRTLVEDVTRVEAVTGRDEDGLEAQLVALAPASRSVEDQEGQRRRVSRRRAPRRRLEGDRAGPVLARAVRHGRQRRSRGAPAARSPRPRRSLRPRQGRGGRRRLPRSPAAGAESDSRQSRGADEFPGSLQADLRRRVSGHRSAAGGDPAVARGERSWRGRLAKGHARAGQAVPRRRSEAVDLPVPPRRHRDLQPGRMRSSKPRARGG